MTLKITQRIKDTSIVDTTQSVVSTKLARPETLNGKTYKIKTPLSDHALYITINDLNNKPFEIFINSKEMEHFQWVVALTRLVSAIFRHGSSLNFLIEELRSVVNPNGGYFKKGGTYCPSLVAEIGEVIEKHITNLGLYQRDTSLAQAAHEMLQEKQQTHKNQQQCPKCHEYTLVLLDGCLTCTACGDSKCG